MIKLTLNIDKRFYDGRNSVCLKCTKNESRRRRFVFTLSPRYQKAMLFV